MIRYLIVICVCLFSIELNSQTLRNDSTSIQKIKLNENNLIDTVSIIKNNFNKVESFNNKLLVMPDELFLLRRPDEIGNSIPYNTFNVIESPSFLTSSIEYRMWENKKEFNSYLNNIYLDSRPTTMQKILGTVNFSAGAALAGYYIWKNYIKKK